MMASRVEVRFIAESDFLNKGNGFILRDCSDWELDSAISLKLTGLLDDISYQFFSRDWSLRTAILVVNFNCGTGTSAGRSKQQLKANRGVGIIVAQNKQSSQTPIPVKRRRRAIRTKTLKCKQITAEIKTGKQPAGVLTKKKDWKVNFVPCVRTSYQNSSNNKSWKIWKPIES